MVSDGPIAVNEFRIVRRKVLISLPFLGLMDKHVETKRGSTYSARTQYLSVIAVGMIAGLGGAYFIFGSTGRFDAGMRVVSNMVVAVTAE